MGSLLYLQAHHRSQGVLTRNVPPPVAARYHRRLPWDDRYRTYVAMAGLDYVRKIEYIPRDDALINALVERWRQETHTFHLPVGELTITLEDVAMLLGLRIDGEALCVPSNCDWTDVVKELLGHVDAMTFRRGSRSRIQISWLRRMFSQCPRGATEGTLQRYARAYLLMLIGTVLFTDHTEDSIPAIYLLLFKDFEKAGRYSWGSAVLAFLYRELCLATKPNQRHIGGATILLQMWCWERFPFGRPRSPPDFILAILGGEDIDQRPPLGYQWSGCRVVRRSREQYRDDIDRLKDRMVNWMPYVNKMDLLPPICSESAQLWRTFAPLIHFGIVEIYNPERVSRQFGIYQMVPPFLQCTEEALHDIRMNEALHGVMDGNRGGWLTRHAAYVHAWNKRWNLILAEQRPYDPSTYVKYMRWYSGSSILYLQAPQREPSTMGERNTQMAVRVTDNIGNAMAGDCCRVLAPYIQCCLGKTPGEQSEDGVCAPPDVRKHWMVDPDEPGECSCRGTVLP